MRWFKRKKRYSLEGHDWEIVPAYGGIVHFSTCWCRKVNR